MKTKKMYFECPNTIKIINLLENRCSSFHKQDFKRWKYYPYWNRKTYSDDKKTCKVFNNFFSNVVSDLKIPDYCNYFPQKKHTHSLSTIIETFEKKPSILNIKKRKIDSVFSFRKTTEEKVVYPLKVIQDFLMPKKFSDEWPSH